MHISPQDILFASTHAVGESYWSGMFGRFSEMVRLINVDLPLPSLGDSVVSDDGSLLRALIPSYCFPSGIFVVEGVGSGPFARHVWGVTDRSEWILWNLSFDDRGKFSGLIAVCNVSSPSAFLETASSVFMRREPLSFLDALSRRMSVLISARRSAIERAHERTESFSVLASLSIARIATTEERFG